MIKPIAILGSGESGTGAALLAQKHGFDVFVSDKSLIPDKYKAILDKHNISYEEGSHSEAKILKSSFVIKSPGIPDKAELVQKLRAANIPVISEIEFAARYTNAYFIVVTGTNGKTTTTLLTYHLLKKAGFNVGLAGNVGESLAKQVATENFDYYVLELSSFQLDGMFEFKAGVAILLNITPDHMDRYEYKIENYVNSKFRVIQNMAENDVFIYYPESKLLAEGLKTRKLPTTSLTISLTEEDHTAFYADNSLKIKYKDQNLTIPESNISIKGKHNMINSMAAVLAALSVDVPVQSIEEGLQDFKNASHRLEFVAEINGVTFINDSKATNVDSVTYALDSYTQPLVWIAGGTDKGNDYAELDELVKKNVKALVCLGADNAKLLKAFSGKVKAIESTDEINMAIKKSFELAQPGDIVLLSPACASFDLFKNYEDRGDKFKAGVLNFKKEIELKQSINE